MNHKKHISILLVLFFLSTSIFSITGEQQKSVLDPENANEARLNRLQPPEKILEVVGISPGMIVAEIGAGRGRYVVQLAVRVGETGKIYAEDIDSSALAYLENRCQHWGLENVETIVGEVTDPKLPQGELDLIFIISSYHHFEDPVVLLQNARSALKPEGRLAIVEWIPWNENDTEGTTAEEMKAQMNAAGYKLKRFETLQEAKILNIYIFLIKGTENL